MYTTPVEGAGAPQPPDTNLLLQRRQDQPRMCLAASVQPAQPKAIRRDGSSCCARRTLSLVLAFRRSSLLFWKTSWARSRSVTVCACDRDSVSDSNRDRQCPGKTARIGKSAPAGKVAYI